jgi:NAD(P)-dependent dehydrogenase (short-subunit alcohol dehydrogenase family)
MENKLWASVLCAQAALPHIARKGSITFCSGVSPRKAIPGYWAPTTAIAALEGFSRVLAVELAPIRVNTVGPGIIATPVLNSLTPQRLKAWHKTVSRQPVGRMGTPEEIAQAMVYCMTNGFTTGTLLEIDGGFKFT